MPALKKQLLLLIVLVSLALEAAAQSPHSQPLRMPPKRSATTVKIGGVEYVPIADLEKRWGLRGTWLKRDERLLLQNERWKIELANDSREAEINGLRILLGEPCRVERRVPYLSRVDAERLIGPILRPGYLQASVPDLRVIAIDPGHGGVDNGAQNTRLGLMEKKLTMDVAVRLARILRLEGFKVILTRETDTKIELPIRSVTANTYGADLFVSIHFNSLPRDTKTHGVEIFTFAPAGVCSTDASGGRVDDTENDPSPVNKYDHWSSLVAYFMHREMIGTLKTFDRGKKIAHFGVLRSLNCPGLLVEAGFLSSEMEARKISTGEYRQEIAESIAKGIRAYGATLSPLRASQNSK
ncbi:MAG: N-acetylmuramoyl-L-alanine amidase [Nibricoccus sp.]